MASVADEIHETKSWIGKKAVAQVVFDKHEFCCHANCFAKQFHCVVGMMKYVYKKNCIESLVCVRKCLPVKFFYRNQCVRSHEHVNATDTHVAALLCDQRRDQSIATTDIQNTRTPWNQRREMIAKYTRSPRVYVATMKLI